MQNKTSLDSKREDNLLGVKTQLQHGTILRL